MWVISYISYQSKPDLTTTTGLRKNQILKEKKRNQIFLYFYRRIDNFLELNLNAYIQYFQQGINFEDFTTYRMH